jgi:DNA-binding NarL/FixJ family response regulator
MSSPVEKTTIRRTAVVLLVEDNESDYELFVVHLPSDGLLQCELKFARTLEAARSILSNDKVDVVVLDLNLPDSVGLDTCRAIQAAAPELPIVVLTGMNDEELGVEAVAAGAQDYLVKGTYDDNLLPRAIRFALERASWGRGSAKGQARTAENAEVAARLESLTQREREVLDHLVQGTSAKCVAIQLSISVQTVAKHRARILEKMRASNDVDLVRLMLGGSRVRE